MSDISPQYEYEEETTWADGKRFNEKGNWATYIIYGSSDDDDDDKCSKKCSKKKHCKCKKYKDNKNWWWGKCKGKKK